MEAARAGRLVRACAGTSAAGGGAAGQQQQQQQQHVDAAALIAAATAGALDAAGVGAASQADAASAGGSCNTNDTLSSFSSAWPAFCSGLSTADSSLADEVDASLLQAVMAAVAAAASSTGAAAAGSARANMNMTENPMFNMSQSSTAHNTPLSGPSRRMTAAATEGGDDGIVQAQRQAPRQPAGAPGGTRSTSSSQPAAEWEDAAKLEAAEAEPHPLLRRKHSKQAAAAAACKISKKTKKKVKKQPGLRLASLAGSRSCGSRGGAAPASADVHGQAAAGRSAAPGGVPGVAVGLQMQLAELQHCMMARAQLRTLVQVPEEASQPASPDKPAVAAAAAQQQRQRQGQQEGNIAAAAAAAAAAEAAVAAMSQQGGQPNSLHSWQQAAWCQGTPQSSMPSLFRTPQPGTEAPAPRRAASPSLAAAAAAAAAAAVAPPTTAQICSSSSSSSSSQAKACPLANAVKAVMAARQQPQFEEQQQQQQKPAAGDLDYVGLAHAGAPAAPADGLEDDGSKPDILLTTDVEAAEAEKRQQQQRQQQQRKGSSMPR
ncbi:hypothetical protein COO60DRAFT_1636702 [Scenedesmus sp. NREL 46B-D3]|nr:hypothetical protein COO60DRAFT_1636702 [Scenedesmus sp. NREL 46B-D3]